MTVEESEQKVQQNEGVVETKQDAVEVFKIEGNETVGFAIVRSKKMNPNAPPSAWSNPPPPGIDMDEEESKHSAVSSSKSVSGSIIDVIDPFIKNPEYIKYKKSLSRERGHYKRSRSRSRDRKKRYHSRRRSRSRSPRGRRHRRYSHSSSRSRSSSYERRQHRHKKRRTRKYSRSNSRSRNKYRGERTRSRRSRSPSNEPYVDNEANEEKCEEDEQELCKENAFKNDGSFLEMFKKLQEEKERAEAEKAAAAGTSEAKRPAPAFGKRRGGRVLKTGMVEKTKACEEDELSNAQDPWSIYLKEVKKYKEACCDDDSKTRPLVK